MVSKEFAHHELEFAYKIIEKWMVSMEKGTMSRFSAMFPPMQGHNVPDDVHEMMGELACVVRNLEHLLITISGSKP